ncbi:hypothetical protein [Rhodoferax sp. GW822-FHT02A01]|uniref:hypothetical protein n=1 Tax=Rhodoferax sp. GW822-FHT02A01 TaxID=3141537 RepID=UPI00315C5C0A
MDFFRKAPKKIIDPLEPIPVGEVQESDWAEWEDSVAFQDSLIGGFPDTTKQPLTPETEDMLDIFANVKKKDS